VRDSGSGGAAATSCHVRKVRQLEGVEWPSIEAAVPVHVDHNHLGDKALPNEPVHRNQSRPAKKTVCNRSVSQFTTRAERRRGAKVSRRRRVNI